jgi:putative transposase
MALEEERAFDREAVQTGPLAEWWARVEAKTNGYIESFHSRLRDEFLERVEFETVADARAKASWFRREYNTVRPHSSLGYATPKEYSAACDAKEERKRKIIR